jgi:ribosome recycling factor
MDQTVRVLREQLAAIRVDGLSPGFVETFRVAVDGGHRPIAKLAALSREGDRLILRAFDPAHVPAIIAALAAGRVSAYAADPRTVCVSVPPLSAEQRGEIARHVKKLGEEAKISIRMIRQQARKEIETRGRGSLRAVQDATDQATEEIDRLTSRKLDALRG